jgi:hypothetical protein
MKTQDQDAHARKAWLSAAREEEERDWTILHYSPQAILLLHDIEKAFCAGAWASVIVMCQTAIEATIRQISTKDYETT